MIPDPSNPQSWNRYSYVTNRPVNFNDPTGHAQSSDDQIKDGDGKCDSGDKACNDLVDLIKKKKDKGRETLDVNTRTRGGHFVSWEGEKNVPLDYWQFTLDEFGKDAHLRATKSKFLKPITAFTYDSDFFNEDSIFTKPLTGRGCFDDNNCYDRSEINYFAQGELWAAYGVSEDKGHDIIKSWKESKCLWMCERNDLQEEYDMFDVGYRHYLILYPRPSPPTNRPR